MKWLLLLFLMGMGIGIGNSQVPTVDKHCNLLFYVQRNLNRNTVVYEANFDANGYLHSETPIKVYWMMYEENGERQPLKSIERMMAYGVECFPVETAVNQFQVQLAADKSHTFRLMQHIPFEAQLIATINGATARLTRLYIQANNKSIWPKVDYIIMEGIEEKTQHVINERVILKD